MALCDLYSDQIDKAKTAIPGTGQARVNQDYRELLANQSIDAVLIATPVFLHSEHFEAAVRARRHIYIEKPAAADPAGVKRLLAAAKQADPSKHIVFRFQNRFSPEYRTAAEIVRTGKLGQLLMMECHFIKGGVTGRKIQYPPEERIRHWGGWRERRAYGDNLDHLSVTYEYPGGLRAVLVATQL